MTDRSPLQLLTLTFGVVFAAVGVLGFIPGVTSGLYDDLGFAGSDSTAELLGIFQISILSNLVHLLFGVVGIVASGAFDSSRLFMIAGGVIYIALFLLGIIGGLDWLPSNTADHWLHVALGVTMVGIGYILGREEGAAVTA